VKGRFAGFAFAVACAALLGGCATPQLPGTPGAPTLSVSAERLVVVTVRNPLAPGVRGAGSTWRGWDWGGQYQRSGVVEREASELAGDYGLREVDAWPIRVLDVHCVVYALEAGQSKEAVLRQLGGDPRVESVQPLYEFGAEAAAGPGSYNDSQRDLQTSLGSMQLEQAHRMSQGRGVKVAVVDTGVDARHPDLSGRIRAEHDFVSRPGAEPHHERHGTAVAGIIGARAGNAEGIIGVAPEAELYSLKACWPLAAGSAAATCNSFTLARALAGAIDLEADVLNLSLSGPADPLLARMVRAAVARGMLVVGAVPENRVRQDSVVFPSSLDGVIAVRSAGPTATGKSAVVPAPGHDVLAPVPGGRYEFQSGSSMATAHVAGVAALLRAVRPELTPAELERLLMAAAIPIGTAASINACLALSQLLSRDGCR